MHLQTNGVTDCTYCSLLQGGGGISISTQRNIDIHIQVHALIHTHLLHRLHLYLLHTSYTYTPISHILYVHKGGVINHFSFQHTYTHTHLHAYTPSALHHTHKRGIIKHFFLYVQKQTHKYTYTFMRTHPLHIQLYIKKRSH